MLILSLIIKSILSALKRAFNHVFFLYEMKEKDLDRMLRIVLAGLRDKKKVIHE